MLAADYLDRVRQMPVAPFEDLTAGAPFVVLSPHPDDETLGTGGLIAQACAAKNEAHVVVLTDGSGSHPRSKLYPRERLIALRQEEVEQAGLVLGLPRGRVRHLGLVDAHAPMSGVAFDSAVAQISDVIRTTRARSLFVTWQCDPHCDHQAAAATAKAVRSLMPAITLWAYPIWGWHLDPQIDVRQPPPRGVRLDISKQAASKRAAIAAHASQMTGLISDDPEGFCFTAATLAPFLEPFEYFIEVP